MMHLFGWSLSHSLPRDELITTPTSTSTPTTLRTGQLVCLVFPVQEFNKPPQALNTQEGPPFEVSGQLYTELLEGEGEGRDAALERLELSGPCPDSIKPRRGREWLGRWRRSA